VVKLVLISLACADAARTHDGGCRYGSEPDFWQRLSWDEYPSRASVFGVPYMTRLENTTESPWPRSPVEASDAPFGSAFRTLRRACQPRPLLRRAAFSPSFVRNTTIVLLGDSVDGQLLAQACTQAADRGVAGWAAYVHSHAAVNYCSLPSGLHLVQKYVTHHSVASDNAQVAAAAAFIAGDDSAAATAHEERAGAASLAARPPEAARIAEAVASTGGKPALVVLSPSIYWVLLSLVTTHAWLARAGLNATAAAALSDVDASPPVLPAVEVEAFVRSTEELVRTVRRAFPGVPIVMHTSTEALTDCATGMHPIESQKVWARRAYVAALNAATRAVAHAARAPLVDFELLGAAFAPAQLLWDSQHPRGFFQLEVLNTYLNLAEQLSRRGDATPVEDGQDDDAQQR
jgi:hypothetical protein